MTNIFKNTINKYIRVLDELFLNENLEALNPNLRSKTTIQPSQIRYFKDLLIGFFHYEFRKII